MTTRFVKTILDSFLTNDLQLFSLPEVLRTLTRFLRVAWPHTTREKQHKHPFTPRHPQIYHRRCHKTDTAFFGSFCTQASLREQTCSLQGSLGFPFSLTLSPYLGQEQDPYAAGGKTLRKGLTSSKWTYSREQSALLLPERKCLGGSAVKVGLTLS